MYRRAPLRPRPASRPAPLLAAGLLLLLAAEARAVQYEAEINIRTEADLFELSIANEISPETLETLLDLLQQGVDLNTASREELYELPNITYAEVDALLSYRQRVGRIGNPNELVAAGALSAPLLEQLAPFINVGAPVGVSIPVSGTVRLGAQLAATDHAAPPAFARARVQGPWNLKAGVLATTVRRRLGSLTYDADRRELFVGPPGYRLEVPKYYVGVKAGNVSLLAGSFRLGFGQRLTLDNTSRYTPSGVYPDDVVVIPLDLASDCRVSARPGGVGCTDAEKVGYSTADFGWRESFRGVAASVSDLGGEEVKAKLTAFGSYQTRSLYQYNFYSPDRCEDPRRDNDTDCSALPVFLRTGDPATAPRVSFSTLPDLYDELAAGGNATVRFGRRSQVGVTGYYAQNRFNVVGPRLDFQENARPPYGGGPFGAVGIDGAAGVGLFDFFAEVSRSMDSMPGGGGGFGAVQRTTVDLRRQELELALRYYAPSYKNPYARAVSAPDQLDGASNRNEAGVRLRYLNHRLGDFVVRGVADFWSLPGGAVDPAGAGVTNLNLAARTDWVASKLAQPGLLLEYRNKDLSGGGRGQCFDTSAGETEDLGVVYGLSCKGERIRAGAVARLVPVSSLELKLYYAHSFTDDPRYTSAYRQDQLAWLAATYQRDRLRLRARIRYLDQGLDDPGYMERSLWTYAEAGYGFDPVTLRLRYDFYALLDTRANTLTRQPRQEHRFRLEAEARF